MADGHVPTPASAADAIARLEQERATTIARIASLSDNVESIVAAARDTATDDEHDPEGQTIAFERSQAQALLSQAREHLDRLDDAARRITSGAYRTCVQCGRPIGDERLAARPTATTCISCASTTRTARG